MKTFATFLLNLLIAAFSFADNITVSGIVKDMKTSAVLDSATVTIVNTQNVSEQYSVITNTNGAWSYNFTTGVAEGSAVTHQPSSCARIIRTRSIRRRASDFHCNAPERCVLRSIPFWVRNLIPKR